MPFEKVYKELALPLTKFVIKRIGGDENAVDEVLSETMIAAWHGWNTFKNKSSYFTWICRIALNKIADYYRGQIHHKSSIVVPLIDIVTQFDTKTLSPEEGLALKELKKSVNNCLDLLPSEKRKLLQLRYWEDLSYSQISKILKISERAVEGRLYRAKVEFAKAWNQNENNKKYSL